MKKIMCLSILLAMLICENKVWFGILDLSIDNCGERLENQDLKEVEDVNVKFRLGDLINYIEKKLK